MRAGPGRFFLERILESATARHGDASIRSESRWSGPVSTAAAMRRKPSIATSGTIPGPRLTGSRDHASNAPQLPHASLFWAWSDRKTGSHFSGSCSWACFPAQSRFGAPSKRSGPRADNPSTVASSGGRFGCP